MAERKDIMKITLSRRFSTLLVVVGLPCIGLSAFGQDTSFLTNGLVGYWSFEEAGGTVAIDSSGYWNNGVVQAGATWSEGKIGSALHFSGTPDSFVQVPSSASLNVSTGLTISAWINSEDTEGARDIVSKWDDETQEWSYIFKDWNESDRLSIELSKSIYVDLASLQGRSPIIPGQWIHVATTYDAATRELRLYFNGELDARSVTGGASIRSSRTDLSIGAGGFFPAANMAGEAFAGLIDEVRIYNRALSETEMQTLYNYENSPILTLLRNADQTVSLSWRGAGALEQTESLTPPNWQPAPSQANPQVISTMGAMKFYRMKAEPAPRPPSIIVQPQSKAVVLGQPVTFSVTAVGSLPLRYQWRKEGQDIPGASQASYSIAAVESNHLGAYTVMVTNQYGAETSRVAHLTQVVPGCPTSQYRFEEGAPDQPVTGDGSILDFVDGSGDGTPNGDPLYRADVGLNRVAACQCVTNKLSLELAEGQSVKINSPFIFHDGYQDATLEFLVKPAEQEHHSIFWTRPDSNDENRFNIYINPGGGFDFDYRSPSGVLHPNLGGALVQIPVDTWTHIAIVRDTQSSAPAHTYDLYVNGVYITTQVDPDPDLPTSDQAWQISGRDGFHFSGSVDEIRFSARKLAPSEFLISGCE
jgi:hypothetical protein